MTFRAGSGAVWVLRSLLAATDAVLTLAIAVAASLLQPWLWWCCPVPTVVCLPIAGLYLPKLARSLHGSVDRQAIHAAYGVLWQRELYAPVKALKTYEIWMPPLHRMLRCRTVVLRFAGGAAWLPLLDRADVERLTAYLETDEETA